jgi:hypothetical protein
MKYYVIHTDTDLSKPFASISENIVIVLGYDKWLFFSRERNYSIKY